MTRTSLAAAALLLGALSGCGGGDAPTDVSEEEFCAAQASLFADMDLGGLDQVPSEEDLAQSFRDWGEEMERVGTLRAMPEDARAGFEEVVARAQDLDAEALRGDGLGEQLGSLTGATDEETQAFDAYVTETCGGTGGHGLPEVPELP